MAEPRLAGVTALFFRIGNTTFGGGDPTMAALQREFDRRRWISPEQFGIAYGLARITPGTNMLAFCAATGWYLLGTIGALAAVLAVTVPSAVLVVWLTHVCEIGDSNALAHAMISAVVAAAVGTMLATVFLLLRPRFSKTDWFRPLVIVLSSFVLARWVGLSPLQVIGIAALTGFVWVRR